jgi:hypothetical protein
MCVSIYVCVWAGGEIPPATYDGRCQSDQLHQLMLVVLQADLQGVPTDDQGGVCEVVGSPVTTIIQLEKVVQGEKGAETTSLNHETDPKYTKMTKKTKE